MADIFNSPISNSSIIADTSTDADSPVAEVWTDKMREWLELALVNIHGQYGTGSLTSDPPNDTTGYLIDTAAGFVDDEHNGRRVIFTTGNAMCQDFLIDDTVAASDRVECTGDNLYSVGARSGDEYIILGNFRDTTNNGHNHTDKNSKSVVLPTGTVMLPFYEENNEQSTTSATYVDIYPSGTNNEWGLYVPAQAQIIRMRCELKNGDSPSHTTSARFVVGSSNSSESTTTIEAGSPYNYYTDCYLDVSALEGWYDFKVQLKRSSNVGYIRACSFIWELA